ncbi:MAG: twin-arginine translocase subunit TatC [Chitinophagales bacterium]|nr:twin-arginine translocase subunit TatC [Chitinophagales bacterium]
MAKESIEQSNPKQEMSFFEHIEVLRWHFFRAFIAVAIAACVIFLYHKQIFDTVLFGLLDDDFPTYRLLCYLSQQSSFLEGLCMQGINVTIQNVDVAGQFAAATKLSILGGLIVTFPYVFWEFWRFVKPGLHDVEVQKSSTVIFWSSLLFLIGCLFGYFIMAPFSIGFLSTFTLSDKVENQLNLANYISFLNTSVLACGIVFELPIISYFLSKVGLLTPEFMRSHRKEAVVANLILSAIVTPGDVSSQLIVALPIFILYEVSIFISARVNKHHVQEWT